MIAGLSIVQHHYPKSQQIIGNMSINVKVSIAMWKLLKDKVCDHKQLQLGFKCGLMGFMPVTINKIMEIWERYTVYILYQWDLK